MSRMKFKGYSCPSLLGNYKAFTSNCDSLLLRWGTTLHSNLNERFCEVLLQVNIQRCHVSLAIPRVPTLEMGFLA
jgi:hypothetical protein